MKEYQKILLVFLLGMLGFAYLFKQWYFVYIGLTIVMSGLIFPPWGKWFTSMWMKFAHLLGRINSIILLTFVFFIILTPLSWIRRLFSRKDILQLKPPEHSNFKNCKHTYQPEDIEQVW